MMTSQQRLAIVRGGLITNRSPKGGRSYQDVRGLMQYIAFGRYQYGRENHQARGIWLDHNGREKSHAAVLGWAKEKVHHLGYEYSYQLLLSTLHGGLTPEDFNRVMDRGSDISETLDWRLMMHQDTSNQHAHVILFRKEKLSRVRYREWQQAMQAELSQIQARRWEQKLEQAEQLQQTQQQLQLEAMPAVERQLHRGLEVGL
jgi:hypothetical protein